MKTTTALAMTVAAVLAATSGCQSGPRWAWWKTDAAPTDTSAVARSAEAPQLPSAQSTPQAVTPTGLQPATSPSAANLAAAGTQPATGIAIPATSPATVANAPLANYPSVNAAADKLTAPRTAPAAATSTSSSTSLVGNSIPQMPATGTMPHAQAGGVASSGPYDPNNYRPSVTAAATSPATTGESPAGTDRYQLAAGDRYGITAVDSSAVIPVATPRSAENVSAAAPVSNSLAGDRYGLATPSQTTTPQASMVAGETPFAATSPSTTSPMASATPAAMPTTVASLTAPVATPTATATVQVATQAGQYRPGGTTSYVGTRPAQHIEVATRPAPPSPTATTPATQPTAPIGSSVPWTPPPAATPPASGTGTQRY
ncbi:MAG: hypothetical protein L0228_13265 [Planctomycetes bacterium]|nr:hypothetical protein [Planctomycetota bacterium]